jgi:hypothetical protein
LLTTDFFGTTIAAILTLLVYSYLLRDNPLYRLAEHLLVATSVAYALVAAVHWVLVPRLLQPLSAGLINRPDLLIPLALGLLLLGKGIPGGARLGNPGLAYLVGMGLALAMGGALVGTLLPQATASMLPLVPAATLTIDGVINNLILVVGTLLVLLSFLFVATPGEQTSEATAGQKATRPPLWRLAGRWFLMITFGAIFGGVALSFLALLVGRWDFLINDWLRPLAGL